MKHDKKTGFKRGWNIGYLKPPVRSINFTNRYQTDERTKNKRALYKNVPSITVTWT